MAPLQREVLGLEEVCAALLAGLVIGIGKPETSVALVVHPVAGVHIDTPGAQGI